MSRRTLSLVVFVAAAALFSQTVLFPFVLDDEFLIVSNSFLHQPWSAVQAFAHDFWHGTPMEGGFYRPLVVLSLALNGQGLGWNPWGFHLVNVLLHATNAVLLLGLLLRLKVPATAALLGALLLAVHPAAAWPVGSIVARVDLLPAFFLLLALHALAAGSIAGTGLAFLAAFLSKESAIAFAAIPFLALRAPLLRPAAPRRLAACGAACAAAAGLGLWARVAAGAGLAIPWNRISPITNPMAAMASPDRVRAALRLAGRYLAYLMAPVRFSDSAGYGAGVAGPGWGSPGVLLGTALLALAGAGAFVLWWRRDRIGVFLALALGTFLPTANLLFPNSSLYAQNFLYLPLLGVSLAAADGLGRLDARRTAPTTIAAVILAILAGATIVESRIWSSGTALFTAWSERFPRYPLAWSRLGVARLQAGDVAGSEPALRRALGLFEPNAEAHYNLGVALALSSAPQDPGPTAPNAPPPSGPDAGPARLEEALDHLRRAAVLQPDLVQAHVNASRVLLLLNRPREAEGEARAALGLVPAFTPARLNLAESLFRQERYADALAEFRDMVRLFPQDPNVRSPFVVALLYAGDPEEARRETEAARRDFPDLAWFDFCLARVEARAGHVREARDLLRRARQRDSQTDAWIAQVHDFDGMPKD
jgi:tetratricopeptide (TPR) repeat protein